MAGKNSFTKDEAGSLFENNLITCVALPVTEQAFEQSIRTAFEFNEDWSIYATRAVCTFLAFNVLKWWTLYRRDESGLTAARRIGVWLWVKLMGD